MSKKKEQQVCKEMVFEVFISVMVAIASLLIAYQSGGLIRLVLAASLGIFAFQMRKCDFRDFCMVILCAVVILLTSGKDTLSFVIITLGMAYAGIVGAYAIYQE